MTREAIDDGVGGKSNNGADVDDVVDRGTLAREAGMACC